MAMSRKRPFSINNEDKKQKIIQKIIEFAKDNFIITEEVKTHSYYWEKHEHKRRTCYIKCPACNKKEKMMLGRWNFINKDVYGEIEKERLYEITYEMITMHIKPQIRLHGSPEHMQLILDIFGDELGLEILNIFAMKNILVAKVISNFIDSKKVEVTNELRSVL